MNIATIFYLADVAKNIQAVCFIVLAMLGPVTIAYFIVFCDMAEKVKKILKLDLILVPIFIVILVFIPSENTIYVYGGQQAIIEISKNKDSQEIVSLIKEITITKLREISKNGEGK